MSLLLALGIVAILILSGFLWGSIEVKRYKRDYKFESKDFINRFGKANFLRLLDENLLV